MPECPIFFRRYAAQPQTRPLWCSFNRLWSKFSLVNLHLVLGPSKAGKPIRYKVSIDGKALGADHGVDTDADGYGTVKEERLYQLIRQHGAIQDHTFRIEFLVPGVQAYAFTFG
jgi:hypothetical protein